MKIESFEILTIEIPLRMSIDHALAKRVTARNILVAARGDENRTGWGECCPRPYVTGETVEGAVEDLKATLLPRLLRWEVQDLSDARDRLVDILDGLRRDQQAAFCAAELAVLDLVGQAAGESAGNVLGPVQQSEVYYSGVIAAEQPEAVKQHAAFMKQFGVRNVKVKVGPSIEANLGLLQTVRTILGDSVELRIDANCAWSADTGIEQLKAMREFHLAGVEQPVPGEDIEGMAAITAAALVPVVADESLCSLADAETLIEKRACDIFNLRVSKCGGLINTGRIYAAAREAGLKCQLGAQVGETGILSAAGRHIATRCAAIVWREGSYGKLLLEHDIVEPDITVGPGGHARALDSPGLGVRPLRDLLEGCTADRFAVRG